jgi:hypothetical protein
MTDIPYAIEDAQLPADFGYSFSGRQQGLGKGLMDGGNYGICLTSIARGN